MRHVYTTRQVNHTYSAQAAWQAHKDLYARETVNTIINLLKKISERKLSEGASLQDHLTGFHNDWIRLKDRSQQENKEVLWAKLEGKDIVIQELQEATRFVSYQECHNALGHPSVQVLSQAMNDLYLDSYLIPKPPKATAVYIKNRLPHSALPQTPYEALKGEKPSIKHLQPFGRKCYMHIPEEARPSGSKLLPQAIEGKFLGYEKSNKIYRIWNPAKPNQVLISRDVRFPPLEPGEAGVTLELETTTPEKESTSPTTEEIETTAPEPKLPEPPAADTDSELSDVPSEFAPKEPQLRRSARERRAPQRYGARHTQLLPDEPRSYTEALRSPDSELWTKAMSEEMDSLIKNKTWEEVDRPTGRTVVDCKWVYKIKQKADGSVERYKARLVGKGFTQKIGQDYEETFAPIARYDSFRILMAIAARNGWRPQQMDVKTAFLYGNLKEEIYMNLPEGYRKAGKVARLFKCIYGLKQSAREWYELLAAHLRKLGFITSHFDPCIFIHTSETTFISIYVDDISIFAPPSAFRQKVKDLGDVRYILGGKCCK